MKILIVDNNATNLKILSMLLTKDGYDIKTATSVDNAIDKISTNTDLIIIDTNLSDTEGGYEACKQIKSIPEYKQIPVILISRGSQTDDIVKAFDEYDSLRTSQLNDIRIIRDSVYNTEILWE